MAKPATKNANALYLEPGIAPRIRTTPARYIYPYDKTKREHF